MRILIAEDDLTSRVLLSAVLKKAGHEVIEASDGQTALSILKAPDAPRLAILDWMMPGMDGLDVVREVRSIQNEIPPYIILLTTKGDKADIIAGLDVGADDYMAKPFDHGELKARIEVGRRMLAMQDRLNAGIADLRQALDQIKTLRGIVPICANCKRIRDDQGYWNQVEAYIREHTEAQFSHGICPDCLKELYPDYRGNARKEADEEDPGT